MPASRIDGRIMGNDRPGPVSSRLRERFWAKRRQGWHATPVDYEARHAAKKNDRRRRSPGMTESVGRVAAAMAALGVCGLAWAGQAAAQEGPKSPTVDAIKKRGELACGVDTGIPGFAYQDNAGSWQGFDIAYCRAIAAAVLGDPEKVNYRADHRQGRASPSCSRARSTC